MVYHVTQSTCHLWSEFKHKGIQIIDAITCLVIIGIASNNSSEKKIKNEFIDYYCVSH